MSYTPMNMQKLTAANKDAEMLRCVDHVRENVRQAKSLLATNSSMSVKEKTDRVSAAMATLSDSFLEIGILTGVNIAVGTLSRKEFEETLSKTAKLAITCSRAIDAKLTDRLIAGAPSEECQFPNWNDTAGVTLPGWSDHISRQQLCQMVTTAVVRNMRMLKPFAKKDFQTSPDEMSDFVYVIFSIKFLCGVILGLHFCGPEHFDKILVKVASDDKEPIMPVIESIPSRLQKFDVEGRIARKVGETF